MLDHFLDVVEAMAPKAFVMENVPGLAFKTHQRFLDDLLLRSKRLGFRTSVGVLSSADFGVPQARRRLFIVGLRGPHALDLREWPQYPRRTAGWALNSLEAPSEPDELPSGPYADLLARVPPGGNYLHFTERYGCDPPIFRNRGRYWSFLLKLHPERPAPTLPAQRLTWNGPFHWENRHLRVAEAMRLQSFPDWYPQSSELTEARKYLGNAVPPLLAAAVFHRVAEHLSGSRLPEPLAVAVAREPAATAPQVLGALPRRIEYRAPAQEVAFSR